MCCVVYAHLHVRCSSARRARETRQAVTFLAFRLPRSICTVGRKPGRGASRPLKGRPIVAPDMPSGMIARENPVGQKLATGRFHAGCKKPGGVFRLPDHGVCKPVHAHERCSIVCRHTRMNTVQRRFCFERSFVNCSAGCLAGFFGVVLLRVVKATPEKQILNSLQSQFTRSCICCCPLA